MPVGSSPAAAPTRQSKSVCNIRQLPKIVNVQFPDKSGQGGGLSLTNGGSFRPDYCKVPAGMDWTTRQSRLVGLRRRRIQFNPRPALSASMLDHFIRPHRELCKDRKCITNPPVSLNELVDFKCFQVFGQNVLRVRGRMWD